MSSRSTRPAKWFFTQHGPPDARANRPSTAPARFLGQPSSLMLDAMALGTTGKQLRVARGAGGTAKDGVIEVQEDHVERVLAWLTQAGHRVRRAGG